MTLVKKLANSGFLWLQNDIMPILSATLLLFMKNKIPNKIMGLLFAVLTLLFWTMWYTAGFIPAVFTGKISYFNWQNIFLMFDAVTVGVYVWNCVNIWQHVDKFKKLELINLAFWATLWCVFFLMDFFSTKVVGGASVPMWYLLAVLGVGTLYTAFYNFIKVMKLL